MIYLEAALLAVLGVMLVNASLSDLKTGRISNRGILICTSISLLCSIPYYIFFAKDCFLSFGINTVLVSIISVLLYAMGIWGAGDSKLLSATVIVFPARLYCLGNRSIASGFLLISAVFIAAFLYVIVDTLYLGVKQRNLFQHAKRAYDWKNYIKGFLFFFFLISLINSILAVVLSESVLMDSLLMTAMHFVLILIGLRLEAKATWFVVIAMGAAWIAALLFGWSKFSVQDINWVSYLIALGLLLFRIIADKYNYKTIPVSELKPGMILSAGSVLAFSQSKVNGLPDFSGEDLKSRLTAEEVDSIHRWSESKYGRDSITIVRKIPFALFIAIGTVAFAVMEVAIK